MDKIERSPDAELRNMCVGYAIRVGETRGTYILTKDLLKTARDIFAYIKSGEIPKED